MESAKEQISKSYKSFCQYMEYDTKGVEVKHFFLNFIFILTLFTINFYIYIRLESTQFLE